MKNFLTLCQQGILLALFFGLLVIANMAPLASNTFIPQANDLTNHLSAIVQAKMALAEGQLPIRVAPFERAGMGYPLFQFSSPSSYMFGGFIHAWLSPNNPLIAYKISIWLALVIGSIYLYRLANQLTESPPTALLTGALYLTTPYLLTLMDRLGNFNETIAMGIIPITLYYNLNYFNNPKNQKLFFLSALTWYLLATSHLVTFIYFSIFFGLFLILITHSQKQSIKNFFKVFIAFCFGSLLAAWFLIPVFLFGTKLKIQGTMNIISPDNFLTPLASLLSAKSISPLPLNTPYSPTTSPLQPAFGWPVLITVGLCIYLLSAQLTNHEKQFDKFIRPLLLLFFISFVLVWAPIDYWSHLPKFLAIGQYSWRLLGQSLWISALLFAWGIYWLFDRKLTIQHVAVGVILLTVATSSWIPTLANAPVTVAQLIAHPALAASKDDYLLEPNPNTQYINPKIPGALSATQTQKYCHRQSAITTCSIDKTQQASLLILPVIYYPKLLDITLNGKSVDYYPVLQNDFPVASVIPQQGAMNIINIRFRGLVWANWISLIAWGVWLTMMLCYALSYTQRVMKSLSPTKQNPEY